MILKKVYAAILLLSSSFIFAQSFSIEGKITDASSNPIAYANILLLKTADSTAITGTTSDDNGLFRFDTILQGQYILKTSYIGFEDVLINMDLIANINLNTIILKEQVESLNEVQLVYVKPTLQRQADRLVFNVERTSLIEGNMLDVIRNTPGVLVLDNSILIKNTAPTVYINDRKVNLNVSEVIELLEGTSAVNIKSIEVITNPSAQYDADSGKVLNIVMSKNLATGYSGSVFTNYTQGVFPKTAYGISNFFKGSKLNAFVNYSYNKRKIDRVNVEIVNYLNEQYRSNIDRNIWSKTHNISFNFDYNFNENNRLSLSSNMLLLPYFKYVTKNKTNIVPRISDSIARFNSNNLSRDLKHNLGFNLDYEHKFKKDNARLALNTHITIYDYRRKQKVDSDYFLGNGSFLESNAFRTRSDQATDIFTSQIDYSLPIEDAATFRTGLKFSNVRTDSKIDQTDIMGDFEIMDPENSDAFDYVENVYAAYLNYEKSWDKVDLNIGLRAEQTNVEGNSMSLVESNLQDYLEWFPSISLSHDISEKTKIYTNYKRSIKRPNYNNLNPFRFFLNDNTIVTGNPALQPVLIDHVVLGTTLGNDRYTLEAYYMEREGNIFELPIQDNINNVITYTPVNFSKTIEFGFDFLTYFDVTERWAMSFLTSFYNTNDKGSLNNENVEIDQWANYSEMSNRISFLKDKSLIADFVLTYISKNVQGFQTVDSRLLSELSMSKSILKGKGILSLHISDLFNDHDFLVKTKYLDQDSSIYTNLDNRYVRLGFRYKFGNTKLSSNARDLTQEERERLSERN